MRDGIVRHVGAGVKGDTLDIGRKNELVVLVDVYGGIDPPQEKLGQRGAIEQLHLQFEISLARMHAHAQHAFHAIHRFVLAHPERDRAIVFDRHKRGRAMMHGPVELHAAGKPRAKQSNQRGLDDVLAIDEIVAVGFIQHGMDASAEARQDAQLDILVFQKHRLIFFIRFGFVIKPVSKWIRVHPSAGALVDAVLEEHRS
jgi:hypothetical protein